MANGGDGGIKPVGDWRIPAVVATVAWFASALAVLGYTLIAYKETADGSSGDLNANPAGMKSIPGYGITPEQIGMKAPGKTAQKAAEEAFRRLPQVPSAGATGNKVNPYGITPKQLGFTPSPAARGNGK